VCVCDLYVCVWFIC